MPAVKRKLEAKRQERERTEARRDGEGAGYKRSRDQYERERVKFIALPKEVPGGPRNVTIGQEPEHEVFRIIVHPYGIASAADFRDLDYRYVRDPEVISFRAIRKCWQVHTGHVVSWWTWEPMR